MSAKPDSHRFDDLFAPFGPVSLRRMFGGEGIFVDDDIIGIVMGERIYLKTDDESRKAFVVEKCKAFTYKRGTGKGVSLRYYAIPERLYDAPEEFAAWARKALEVARAKETKRK